ncbi:MAG: DUF3616 domain-containing protein [Mariprofundaceae bacterium]|nr:DUF3616 domain-containing protein [Mariprofundaceae bacterium]
MHKVILFCVIIVCMFFYKPLYAKTLNGMTVELGNGVIGLEDISGIAAIGGFLVIASDEAVQGKNFIQFLKQDATGKYLVDHEILLFSGAEMDIEALAVEKNTVYAIGSHASKRKKTKPDKSYKKNLKTFKDKHIVDETARDQLYRIVLDDDHQVLDVTSQSLHTLLITDPVFKIFSPIPSKENGIDIEGLATKNAWLYVGFRGPVFRENHVPILRLQFDGVMLNYDLLYVRLGGRGIRGMTEVKGGFLLLAGPVGDGDARYLLYFWDGNTMLVGKKRHGIKQGVLHVLGEIIPPNHQKAEGIVLMQENKTSYHVIVAYDGAKKSNDILQSFVVAKPCCD